MTRPPLASVIVPAYQAELYLRATIASVMAQTAIDRLEMVVVDAGSTDRTGEIADAFGPPVRVVRLAEQAGPSVARNVGVEHSHGELLMFLDADDLWPRDSVAHRLGLINDHPEIDVLAGSFTCFSGELNDPIGDVADYEPESWWTFSPCSATIRRSAFEAVGPFDPSLTWGEDTDWYLRSRAMGQRIWRDPKCHSLYRQHAASLTMANRAQQSQELFSTIRRHRARSGPP